MKTFTKLCIFNLLALISCQMVCRDESNNPVDWYVVYKLPKVANQSRPLDTGLHYVYMTSNSHLVRPGWVLSDRDISDQTSLFGRTLNQLNTIQDDITYIYYNNQPPNKTADESVDEYDEGVDKSTPRPPRTGPHAKGVIAADTAHGFWLIHSIPKLAVAEIGHQYVYPSNGVPYGQSALCISYNIAEIDKILEHMLVMKPKIHRNITSSYLKSKRIDDLIHQRWSGEQSRATNITSVGGVKFTSISKAPANRVDLYSQIVAPTLNASLWVETWRREKPLLSYCQRPYTVENVLNITIPFGGSAAHFGYTNDHGKWAIGQIVPYVCVGDLNRMEAQYARGGGTTCFYNVDVWEPMNEWVTKLESCH